MVVPRCGRGRTPSSLPQGPQSGLQESREKAARRPEGAPGLGLCVFACLSVRPGSRRMSALAFPTLGLTTVSETRGEKGACSPWAWGSHG